VAGNHADCPPGHSRGCLAAQFARKILEEECGDSIAGSPSGQQIDALIFGIHWERVVNVVKDGGSEGLRHARRDAIQLSQ